MTTKPQQRPATKEQLRLERRQDAYDAMMSKQGAPSSLAYHRPGSGKKAAPAGRKKH